MDKFRALRVLLLAAAGAVVLAVAGVGIAAQSATPATQAAQPITDAVLAKGLPADAPGKVLQLERVTIAPGAAIPTHVHPGAYAIWVESGDFGFTVVKGTAEMTRAGATAAEPIAAGAEVVGHAGDAFFENGGVVHSARNAGSGPVVVLTAALLVAGQPSLMPTNDQGTPTS